MENYTNRVRGGWFLLISMASLFFLSFCGGNEPRISLSAIHMGNSVTDFTSGPPFPFSLELDQPFISSNSTLSSAILRFETGDSEEQASRVWIVRNGASCTDGTVIYSWQDSDPSPVDTELSIVTMGAEAIPEGKHTLRVCAEDSTGATYSLSSEIIRDDTAPTLTITPSTGIYNSAQEVQIVCDDGAGSGCDSVIYTDDGATDPAFYGDGSIISGAQYSGASYEALDQQETEIRALARDRSGNVSAIKTENLRIDSTVAQLTLVSVPPIWANASDPGSFSIVSDTSGTIYVKRGADCASGTTLVGAGSITANSPQTINVSTASLSEGDNTVLVCQPDLFDRWAMTSVTIKKDSQAPELSTSTPSPGATSVSPNPGAVQINFDESMRSADLSTMEIVLESSSASGHPIGIPEGVTLSWSSGSTIEVTGLRDLPENTGVSIRFPTSSLKDLAGNAIAANAGTGFFAISFGTTVRSVNLPPVDTQQTACRSILTPFLPIACSGLGQDGDYTNTPRGPSLLGVSFLSGFPNDPINVDPTTGITWKTCPEGQSWNGAQCTNPTTPWEGNWGDAVARCYALNSANGGLGYAGISTWHLATIPEWHSVLTYRDSDEPMLHSLFPGQSTDGTKFWTGTSRVSRQDRAYHIHTYAAKTGYSTKSDSDLLARCTSRL